MTLKIGRYTFENITNKDWILDNGACYQCMTLKHKQSSGSPYYIVKDVVTGISKKLFSQLVKEGKIVRYTELEQSNAWKKAYGSEFSAWRFNTGEVTENE